MFGLGIWELLIVLAIIVVLFGAKRLPLIGEGLGGMITNFKTATKKNKDDQAKIDESTTAVKEESAVIKEENS
ncbi:MAG: twin-arginine translocase TatA/TatE family subunit [Proteobacteria bacterium]|jgi:sec-independent protein translocase protein TatA|nr:MAG: twin-arginine translocase TatA/TatE family subunit [Pseudomonadota bacterium]HAF89448.1 twin-arginine translocase TatA/TatE family subunit [Deltaproteobacteria bacterium]|tara:strand:- start:1647 stop:1865 length:219 start_codon:yes stop_codon:yes gene_type:complete